MKVAGSTLLCLSFLLAACRSQAALPASATLSHTPALPASSSASPTFTIPPSPTVTQTPSPTLFPLPTLVDPIPACEARRPDDDDLYVLVTAAFGLDPDYVPGDLVKLGGYVSGYVTPPDQLLRRPAAEALGQLVSAMQEAGLHPRMLSAYRGYYDQVTTFQHWLAEDPDLAGQVSAAPGHSEHQLGTVIDFGSPELPALVGDPLIRFHPLFAETSEGRWLQENAHRYGFTLTNPPGAQPWTGLTYEPWHYRYVGVGLATYLRESGSFFAGFILQARPSLPCIPSLGGPR